jgi:hypothetical protein
MTDAAFSRRVNPLAIPDTETPDETYRRLRPLAEAELTAATAELAAEGISVLAAGVDGSLGTRQVWPSSDIDVLFVTETEPRETIQWRIRDGYIVHRHLSSWPMLTALRDGYPQSFIDTAAGDWIRDPTWMLDGLATFAPVSDPDGRLLELRAFFESHRFAPEVVLPRRPLLLKRAAALREEAGSLVTTRSNEWAVLWPFTGAISSHLDAERRIEWAAEALAILWLEAAAITTSHKELDSALARAAAAQGMPEAHALFREAAGLPSGAIEPTVREAVRTTAREALRVYSPWLETVLERSPNNMPDLEKMLPRLVYLRHRLWTTLLAADRDAWLHLSADRTFYAGIEAQVAALIESDGRNQSAPFVRALRALGESLPLTPLETRLNALAMLHEITAQSFCITDEG